MELYIGTILLWALNYVPDGLMLCQGQILQANQYQALYALIGNMYGGTAPTTFALPNLSGRFPIGLPGGDPGVIGGLPQVTITPLNLPAHTHVATVTPAGPGAVSGTLTLNGVNASGTDSNPGGNFLAADGSVGTTPYLAPGGGQPVAMANGSITAGNLGVTLPLLNVAIQPGGGVSSPAALKTMPPFINLNFAIVVQGLWPPRP